MYIQLKVLKISSQIFEMSKLQSVSLLDPSYEFINPILGLPPRILQRSRASLFLGFTVPGLTFVSDSPCTSQNHDWIG